jgi:hypothetical protein
VRRPDRYGPAVPPRRAVLAVAALLALVAGCGESTAALDRPVTTLRPATGGPAELGAGSISGGGSFDDGLRAVEPWPPASPVEAFRAFESGCGQHSTLAGRGDPSYPRVEPDRFADAVVVRDLAPGTALVADGRGTRLVVSDWDLQPALLAPSGRPGEPLPDPYRLGCGPGPVVQQPTPPQMAPGG